MFERINDKRPFQTATLHDQGRTELAKVGKFCFAHHPALPSSEIPSSLWASALLSPSPSGEGLGWGPSQRSDAAFKAPRMTVRTPSRLLMTSQLVTRRTRNP